MLRFLGNEKAWAAFLMTFMTALLAKFGFGEAPEMQTLIDQAKELISPLIYSGLTYMAAWLTGNTAPTITGETGDAP